MSGPTLSKKQARADEISAVSETEFDALHAYVYDAMLDLDLTVEEGKELIETMCEKAIDAGRLKVYAFKLKREHAEIFGDEKPTEAEQKATDAGLAMLGEVLATGDEGVDEATEEYFAGRIEADEIVDYRDQEWSPSNPDGNPHQEGCEIEHGPDESCDV